LQLHVLRALWMPKAEEVVAAVVAVSAVAAEAGAAVVVMEETAWTPALLEVAGDAYQ